MLMLQKTISIRSGKEFIMKNGKFVLGILGLGEGRSILSAALNSSYYTIGNICDLQEDLCRRRCEEFHLAGYTTHYEDLLSDPEIDIIGIYTPDQLHARHIAMALQAGKDVICTKPLFTDLHDARMLLECQRKSGRHVFVGQSTRFFESVKNQRAAFEDGSLGELVTLETHYKSDSRWFLERPWSKTEGFSWMYNFMIHAVDLAVWYLPEIEEVFGYGVTSSNTKAFGITAEDTLSFLLKNRDGRFATVEGSYATPCLNSRIEFPIECTLRGTRGISRGGYNQLVMYQKSLKKDLADPSGCYALNSHTEDYYDDLTLSYQDRHDYYFRFEGETHHAGEYQNYIEYYAREILSGRTPFPDLSEGIHTIAVMEAMHRSLKAGTPVRVSDVMAEYGLGDLS